MKSIKAALTSKLFLCAILMEAIVFGVGLVWRILRMENLLHFGTIQATTIIMKIVIHFPIILRILL